MSVRRSGHAGGCKVLKPTSPFTRAWLARSVGGTGTDLIHANGASNPLGWSGRTGPFGTWTQMTRSQMAAVVYHLVSDE